MSYFRLGLAQRLLLVFASAALIMPANQLDSILGEHTYVLVLPWWTILHGIVFGGLVLVPFIDTTRNRPLRAAALMIASVLIYKIAIEAPDLLLYDVTGDEDARFAFAGFIGATLTAIVTKYVAAFRVLRIYWLSVPIAGAMGGFYFNFTFDFCVFDTCDSIRNGVLHVSGWFVWQALVCVTIYAGRDRSHIIRD